MFKKAELEIYDLDLLEDIITVSGDLGENLGEDAITPMPIR